MLGGGLEVSQWKQGAGERSRAVGRGGLHAGDAAGLGATPTYLHSQGTVGARLAHVAGLRAARRLLRRHGARLRGHDDAFGFAQVDYEAIQHIPLLRDTWVLSLHGRVETTYTDDDEQIPFFMLPALGGGSSLRGFSSWRFRDRNSLLLQAEWRVMANRFLDMALFYDAGKVTARRAT